MQQGAASRGMPLRQGGDSGQRLDRGLRPSSAPRASDDWLVHRQATNASCGGVQCRCVKRTGEMWPPHTLDGRGVQSSEHLSRSMSSRQCRRTLRSMLLTCRMFHRLMGEAVMGLCGASTVSFIDARCLATMPLRYSLRSFVFQRAWSRRCLRSTIMFCLCPAHESQGGASKLAVSIASSTSKRSNVRESGQGIIEHPSTGTYTPAAAPSYLCATPSSSSASPKAPTMVWVAADSMDSNVPKIMCALVPLLPSWWTVIQ